MEDDVAVVPRFLQVPTSMRLDEHVPNGMDHHLSHLNAHFFGVYDGHGGCQVCFMPPFFYYTCVFVQVD